MNPHVTSLIECLMETQLSISDKKIERCGFLLSMLIEKHSKQRTPGSFYEENLPEPYVDIVLDETEYREIVSKLCHLLNSPVASTKSKDMILFALYGTDSSTLTLSIPALVKLLGHSIDQPIFEDCTKCLARMLSSPDQVRKQALEIRQVLPDLADLVELIGNAVGQEGQASCVLAKLQRLLAD